MEKGLTDGPTTGVDEDGSDGTLRSPKSIPLRLDLSGCSTIRDAKVQSQVDQGDDLEGNTEQERPTTTKEVNEEDSNEDSRPKLDDGVASSSDEGGFVAGDAEVTEDGGRVLGDGVGSRPLEGRREGKGH